MSCWTIACVVTETYSPFAEDQKKPSACNTLLLPKHRQWWRWYWERTHWTRGPVKTHASEYHLLGTQRKGYIFSDFIINAINCSQLMWSQLRGTSSDHTTFFKPLCKENNYRNNHLPLPTPYNTFIIRYFLRSTDTSSFPVLWKKRQINAFTIDSKLQLSQERYYKTDFWWKTKQKINILPQTYWNFIVLVVELYNLGLCIKKLNGDSSIK